MLLDQRWQHFFGVRTFEPRAFAGHFRVHVGQSKKTPFSAFGHSQLTGFFEQNSTQDSAFCGGQLSTFIGYVGTLPVTRSQVVFPVGDLNLKRESEAQLLRIVTLHLPTQIGHAGLASQLIDDGGGGVADLNKLPAGKLYGAEARRTMRIRGHAFFEKL